jgi:hypothetical protein
MPGEGLASTLAMEVAKLERPDLLCKLKDAEEKRLATQCQLEEAEHHLVTSVTEDTVKPKP